MNFAYINDEVNFTSKIDDLINTDEKEYDNNQFENMIDIQSFNQNVFSNLHNLFKEEHDRIFNEFTSEIDTSIDKINKELKDVSIEYDSEKFIEECKEENIKKNNNIKKELSNTLDINFDNFKESIYILRNHYSKLNIETFNLEKDITTIIKKHDDYYSQIKDIYSKLNDLDGIQSHLQKIDTEICEYSKNYLEKNKVNDKIRLYQKNIKEINFLKKYLNEINSVTFVPFCQICMSRIVDRVIMPCGHTACQLCLNKCEMSCFICRTDVTNINKLFIT